MQKRKMPRDVNQLAKAIVDATAQLAEAKNMLAADLSAQVEKNPAAVALGRLGGKRGGPARAAKLSKKKRAEIARKAAQARWKRSKQ